MNGVNLVQAEGNGVNYTAASCTEKAVTPAVANGVNFTQAQGNGVNYVPASCTEKAITPATVGPVAKMDATVSEVQFVEGNVSLTCPDQNEVPTQDVEFKELVTKACLGDTIKVDSTGWTWGVRTVKYRIVVRYFKPGSPNYVVALKTEKTKETVDGMFYDSIEDGFTFDKEGTYAFIFRVFKPDGTLGSARSRVVIVEADCQQPELPTALLDD